MPFSRACARCPNMSYRQPDMAAISSPVSPRAIRSSPAPAARAGALAGPRGARLHRPGHNSRGAQRALKITEDNERLIGSVLLGNNLVNILAASMATALFTRVFGESGVALATLVMTLLVLIFAEVLPKTFAITNAERAAAFVAAPIALVIRVFAPVVGAVRILVRGILSLFGVKTDPDSHILAVREEIAGALHLGWGRPVQAKLV